MSEQKRNKRISKKTVLIIAEGLRDANFLKYLKSCYTHLNKLNMIIRNGQGGTADGLVQETINTLGSYDNRATVIDNDKGKNEMERANNLASSHNIKLIKNTPCIEATLLSILGKKQDEIPTGTGQCKLKYKKEFLNNKKMEDNQDLIRMFPKKVLNNKRKSIPLLNDIISAIEGKFIIR
jgi:hypothetical protein